MAYELDAHTPSMGLMVKRGQQVNFVEGTGKVYDELPASAASPYPRSKAAIIATSMSMPATANRAPLITSGRPDQDVVIDTSGVAYSVRLHLGKHLHMNQRVEKLERAVAALQGQVYQQQSIMCDLRRENFVTQGAFMAAQLCKADVGAVKSQRRKLEHVCELLVSAGILDDSIGDGLSVREQDATICNNDNTMAMAKGENNAKRLSLQKDAVRIDEAAKAVMDEEKGENEAKLISLQNDVARIDDVVTAVRDEAKRALRAAEDVKTNATEKSERECRQAEERYSKVSADFAEVREEVKEDRERIETNSTRLFRLAAEVETLLSERNCCSGYAGAGSSMNRSREETGGTREEAGYVSSGEIADHSFTQTECSPSESPLPSATEEGGGSTETPTADREALPSRVCTEVLDEDDPEVGQQAKVEATMQEHAPRRPGVLDAPGETEPQQSARTAFLSATGVPVAFPAANSSRRATRVGRRVVTGKIKDQVVEPARPYVGRPSKARPTLCSCARGSWPLLASDVGKIRVGAAGEGSDDNAGQVKHMTREHTSMPNLTRKCTTAHEAPKQDESIEDSSSICTKGDTAVGGHDEAQNTSAERQEDAAQDASDYNLTRKCTTAHNAPKQDKQFENSSVICTKGDTAVGGGHDKAQKNSAEIQEDAALSASDYIARLRDLGRPRTTSPQTPPGGTATSTDDPKKENDVPWLRGNKGRYIDGFETFQPPADNENSRYGIEAWDVTATAGSNYDTIDLDVEEEGGIGARRPGPRGAGLVRLESFQPPADNEKSRDGVEACDVTSTAGTNYGTIDLDVEVGGVGARRGGPRGAGLVCLEGAPTLWCPRDTWEAVESSVGSNSSTSGRRGEDSETTLCDPSITGNTDQP